MLLDSSVLRIEEVASVGRRVPEIARITSDPVNKTAACQQYYTIREVFNCFAHKALKRVKRSKGDKTVSPQSGDKSRNKQGGDGR